MRMSGQMKRRGNLGIWLAGMVLLSAPARGTTAPPDLTSVPLLPASTWQVTASSQEADLSPDGALEPGCARRWSSCQADGQWWSVDFGRTEILGGLRIDWETAFARTYSVLVSEDGRTWTDVHSETNGHGGSEIIVFDPRPVRHVKLDLRERGTGWGFSICSIVFNPPVLIQRRLAITAAASSSASSYGPELVLDGDPHTRWSSECADPQWWEATFPEPVEIAGLKILWEDAFGEKYDVQVSTDDRNWQTVYTTESGDGGPDILFFAPVKTRKLRIVGRQRGTGWGYSIWDVEFFLHNRRLQAQATQATPQGPAKAAVDGRRDTAWCPGSAQEAVLTLTLPEAMSLGGVALTWNEEAVTNYAVQLSADGQTWQTVAHQHGGNGGEQIHYFATTSACAMRIVLPPGCGQQAALANVEFKAGEEQATPLRCYQAKAKDLRTGLLPMWLNRQQEFWTIVGLPDDSQESLLGETGIVEPFKGSFSVQPMIWANNHLYTWNEVALSQSLEDRILPLPSVHWQADGWTLDVSALMTGPVSGRVTAVRYRFRAESSNAASARLALAIRPLQVTPTWQHGGFSPIRDGCFEAAQSTTPARFLVNGTPRILFPAAPPAAGTVPLAEGDIGEFLDRGAVPPATAASDADGQVSAGAWFDLDPRPDATTDVVVAFALQPDAPLPDVLATNPGTGFESLWQEQRADWSRRLAQPKIEIPEPRLIEVLKSNLGYILINHDNHFFKPGPRNYNHAWMRDGVLTGAATLRCGLTDLIRDFIQTYSQYIRDDGWVPWMILETGQPVGFNADPNSGEGQEYDSQGEFPFIVRQYLDYTGDEALARQMYPHVIRAIRYAHRLRERRMTAAYRDDPALRAYYGILPCSNSHEGYYPARHSYWDDFWLLRGIKDAHILADRFGYPDDAAWLQTEEDSFRHDLYASIRAVMKSTNMQTIPGCVELADQDPTSTTMAVMVADERDNLPQPEGFFTWAFYWRDFLQREQPGNAKLYTPYEVRNADVFVRLGWREQALDALRFFVRDAVRPAAWNHMAEVVHVAPRTPAYIGDMPHTWVGADYINAVRALFAFEDGDRLILAAGVDPDWFVAGIRVTDLPTQFGRVSYQMHRDTHGLHMILSGDLHPPGGIEIPLPAALNDTDVTLNNRPWHPRNGVLYLKNLTDLDTPVAEDSRNGSPPLPQGERR